MKYHTNYNEQTLLNFYFLKIPQKIRTEIKIKYEK